MFSTESQSGLGCTLPGLSLVPGGSSRAAAAFPSWAVFPSSGIPEFLQLKLWNGRDLPALTRPCHQLWPGAHIPGNGSSFFTLAEALGFFIPPPPHFQQDTNAGENRPSPRLCTDPPQPARVLASPAQSLDQTLHYHMAGKPSGKSVLVNPVRKNNPKAENSSETLGGP